VWEKLRYFVSQSKQYVYIYTDTNVVLEVTDALPFTKHMHSLNIRSAGVKEVVVQPLDCWDRGFEFRLGLSLLCVSYIAPAATNLSLVQRSLTGCVCLIVCDLVTS